MDEIEIEMEDVYVEENKSNDLSQQNNKQKTRRLMARGVPVTIRQCPG